MTKKKPVNDIIVICDSNDPKNPHSIEAEQAVIGGIMLTNGKCYPHISFLTPADFYQPRHKFLFEFLVGLINQGIPTDPITTTDYLNLLVIHHVRKAKADDIFETHAA